MKLRTLAAAVALGFCSHASVAMPIGGVPPTPPPSDSFTGLLATTCTDCWVDTSTAVGIGPNKTMQNVWPTSGTTTCPTGGLSALNVTDAWGGGALDTDNEQLIVWGGGHVDYCGNEVYAYKLSTLQWSLLRGQSTPNASNTSVYADGRPASVHTYDGLAYVPGKGMFQIGGSRYDDGASSGKDWYFNTVNGSGTISGLVNDWISLPSPPAMQGLVISAVYDSVNNQVFAYTENFAGSGIWNVGSGTWTNNGIFNNPTPDIHQTCTMKPGDTVVWCTGAGFTYNVTIANGNVGNVTTTGNKACENYNAPGIVYYPASDEFVCSVPNDSNLYVFNRSTLVWTAHTPGAGNGINKPPPEDVGPPAGNGLFGRGLQWDASHGAFIQLSGTGQHVWAYKPGPSL